MKILKNILAFSAVTLLMLVSTVQPVAALGGWVDHKFVLERPDGTKMDLKGAKMHVFHSTEEGGFTNVNSFCAYPEKDSNFAKYIDSDGDLESITDDDDKLYDYHCVTPQSCSNSDFGAPYLPKSFNSNESIYNKGNGAGSEDGSYRAFHSTNFTGALTGNVAYLAGMYKEGNIRGFDGAKWEMKLDYTRGSGVRKATQAEINSIPGLEGGKGADWGNIPGISGKQEWKEGEVYKDTNGENQLHARITWVLKPPAPAPVVKPTATLTGKCANNTPGVPSYSYTLTNIDLKGQEFGYSRIFLRMIADDKTRKVAEFLGTPSYGTTNNGNQFGYNIHIYNTQPANGTAFIMTGDTRIGNPTTGKKVSELVTFMDANRASVPATLDIAANLESKSAGTTTFNDYIKSTFQPKFTNNECGQPTGGGTVPACISIKMLNNDNVPITNPAALKPGDGVKFECAKVAGVTKYAFKTSTFNAQGAQQGASQNLAAESATSNRSVLFRIPANGGRFTAQCAFCDNNSQNCQFDVTNYKPPASGGTTACMPPNSCVTTANCASANRVSGSACPVTGQVCCTTAPRDE